MTNGVRPKTPGCPECDFEGRECYICEKARRQHERSQEIDAIEARVRASNPMPLDHSANMQGAPLYALLRARGD